MAGSLGGADGDLGVPTINIKKVDNGLLGDVGAVDPEASTINTKNHRWWTPWWVPEL
jgi:hypothetical protein